MTTPRDAEREQILDVVRKFVERDVLPVVTELESTDTYPQALFDQMAKLGLFALTLPEEYGGLDAGYETVSRVLMELSQGWMTLSGVLTAQFTVASMILRFGTTEQKNRLLPSMAAGELKACFSITEPGTGSDAQAITTRARKEGDDYLINGQKIWATHALNAGLLMALVVTDPEQSPRHKGITAMLIEKQPGATHLPGLEIRNQKKLGYKGMESSEIFFDDMRIPASSVLGGDAGLGVGFKYTMGGLDSGRLSVSSSAIGIALGGLKRALAYSQQRKTFGQPICQHQAIQLKLAQMATKIEAAKALTLQGARKMDNGERADLDMAMAKLFATEMAMEVTIDSMRIHGGFGYSPEFMVERFFREVPVLILGEGSNEILQILIARKLVENSPA
ncbi:butyryl-CoA dehydrogenase [Paraburkholderia sp. BL27I4N3]|uniref:acyl-CoA dehydrogenase family protein n=1 Tax=Paraburkholderia sp. BL27I4N3 TaxID=1938805 RepID=UPI000E246506|nr:acyl-CoA dehydrogenase family protein [Paraburkholderia sp. BL27I4N3]REE07480.1 butyryl-CoA dehydrogenase [Paraburkholderia sp. BL27I4N3]